MIRIYYDQSEDGHELSIYGHANYESFGKDIVCAGVSAISFALMGYLEQCEEEIEELDGPVVTDGKMFIRCSGTKAIDAAFHMAVVGLRQIADAYPRHVEIV